jgi:hypothetical protein
VVGRGRLPALGAAVLRAYHRALGFPRAAVRARGATFALLIVLPIAAAIRLALLEVFPLVVTPDALWYPEGRGYLVWAEEIHTRGEFAGPPLRTPGYPSLLAAAFASGGVRDHAVLGLQHLLGLSTVALITLVAAKRAGPRVAIATGALASLDPWHLLFAHYALGEAAAAFFAVASAAAVLLLPPSRAMARGAAAGLCTGVNCLVRPSNQLFVPFFGAAALLAGPRERRRIVAAAAAFALGLALALGPWLAFNAARGIPGLAVQRESLLFVPLVFHRLLDARDMPADTPDGVRRAFGASEAARADPAWADTFLWVSASSGLSYEQRWSWSRSSLLRNLRRYPAAAWDTLRALLGVARPGHPPIPDELLAFVIRLTSEPRGSTLQSHGMARALPTRDPVLPPALAERLHAGLASGFDLASRMRGVPQVPLAILACAAFAFCVLRRHWAEAAVLAGSLAFVAVHAVILYPHQRFILPAQMLWYLALPLLAGALAAGGSHDRPAAVDGEDVAGDEGRGVGSEEEERADQLVELAAPAERSAAAHPGD